MNNLAFATIAELKSYIKDRKLSPQELLEFFLRRMELVDPTIKSLLEIYAKDSIAIPSTHNGQLSAIPGITKANICVKDRTTSCGSKILEHFKSPYSATAIEHIVNEGGYIIGQANMDEFAMGSSTETSAFHVAKNPWDTTRVPGGSSGGSAAAVAAGLIPWALGSETGGSVRQPAAFCGVVGSKPTYGLVSRYGLVAYASSLDQIGVCTRTVYDNALVLSVIAGTDARDSSTLAREKEDYTKHLTGKLPDGLTIGIIDNAINAQGMDPVVVSALQEVIRTYEKLGAKIKHVTLPSLEYSAATYFILSRAEAASNLARFDGVRYGLRNKKSTTLAQMYAETRHDGFGEEVKSRIMVGNYVLSSGHAGEYYDNAQKARRLIRQDFVDMFKSVDILLMPTHPAPAFKIGAFAQDKLQMDLQDYFTCPINIAGIPAISLPCGLTPDKLPIGFQVVAPHCAESLMFQVAHAYEQATEWHTLHPAGF